MRPAKPRIFELRDERAREAKPKDRPAAFARRDAAFRARVPKHPKEAKEVELGGHEYRATTLAASGVGGKTSKHRGARRLHHRTLGQIETRHGWGEIILVEHKKRVKEHHKKRA